MSKRERQASGTKPFAHSVGDVVLVRWSDERIYYAKIKSVNKNKRTCQIMFEDTRRATADFDQIHAVDSTVDDWIACIVCKFGTSDPPNQIVLCDICGVAYHQKCHRPNIPDSALEYSAPWACYYCETDTDNPYLNASREDVPFAELEIKTEVQQKPTVSQTTHNRSRSTIVDEESDDSSAEQYVDSSSSDYFVPSPGKRRPSRSSRHGPSSSGSSKKRRPSSSSAKESATPRSSRPAGQIVTDNRTVAGYAEWMHRQQQQQDNEGQQNIARRAEPKANSTESEGGHQARRVHTSSAQFQPSTKWSRQGQHINPASQNQCNSDGANMALNRGDANPHNYQAAINAWAVASNQQLYYNAHPPLADGVTDILKGVFVNPGKKCVLNSEPNAPQSRLIEQFEDQYKRLVKSVGEPSTKLEGFRSKGLCYVPRPSECLPQEEACVLENGVEEAPGDQYKCAGCGDHAQFLCSRCETVWYCSQECQERSYMVFCQKCTSFD